MRIYMYPQTGRLEVSVAVKDIVCLDFSSQELGSARPWRVKYKSPVTGERKPGLTTK